MFNIGTKSNLGGLDDSKNAGKLGAGEDNSRTSELKNLVESTGQTLSPNTTQIDPDSTQVSKAAFIYGTAAGSMLDGGSADAYELTPERGATGPTLPGVYSLFDGVEVSFIASATNTGASTIDIGQTAGTLLGVKDFLTVAGDPLTSGDIVAGAYIKARYDIGEDGWLFVNQAIPDTGFSTAEIYYMGQT